MVSFSAMTRSGRYLITFYGGLISAREAPSFGKETSDSYAGSFGRLIVEVSVCSLRLVNGDNLN